MNQPVEATRHERKHTVPYVLAVPFLIVFFQFIVSAFSHPQFIDSDVAHFLQCAELVLKGKIPYVDFVEYNPPLIFYLYIPIVWFAQTFNEPISIVVVGFHCLLIVYSLLASWFILLNHAEPSEWKFLLPLLFASLLFNLFLLCHSAQREYIFTLLFIPFFLLRWQRSREGAINPLLALIVGCAAAVGICLKPPFFLLLPIALEGYWLATSGKLWCRVKNPEMVSAAGTFLLIVIWFFLFCPVEMRNNYLQRWAPSAVVAANSGYYRIVHDPSSFYPIGSMLPHVAVIIAVVLVGAIFCRRVTICLPLIIWVISSWLIYLIQGKGFPYHAIPLFAGYFMLANVELALLANLLLSKYSNLLFALKTDWSKPIVAFAVYSAIFCACSPLLAQDSTNTYFPPVEPLKRLVTSNTRKDDHVLVIMPLCWGAYPTLLQEWRLPASRYLTVFPFPNYEALKYKDGRRKHCYDNEERVMFTEICEDIEKTKPTLIAISSWHIHWPHSSFSSSPFSYMSGNGLVPFLRFYEPVGMENGLFVWVRRQ